MRYLLFIFAKHESQEKFMKALAEEVALLADSDRIRYYFGPESAVMCFDTPEKFEEIKYVFEMILGGSGIVYFLTPFETDKMSFWLDTTIQEHLFGEVQEEKETEKSREEQIAVQKLLFGAIEKELDKEFEELDDEFQDIDEIQKIKSKPRKLSLNELLDKINEKGYNSLTKKELSLLEEYSKK